MPDMADMALTQQGEGWHTPRHRNNSHHLPRIVLCDYCRKPAEKVDSKVVYGKSYGMIYLCKCVPGWAYVGIHKITGDPLGRLADNELREWKKMAHAAFDSIWKEQGWRRGDAYKWLGYQLGLPKKVCHIGMFDVDGCKRVIDACRVYKHGPYL